MSTDLAAIVALGYAPLVRYDPKEKRWCAWIPGHKDHCDESPDEAARKLLRFCERKVKG